MNIGSAWARTEEVDGKKVLTGISVSLEDSILELCPQLGKVKFVLKPIPKEQQKSDKAPNYRVVMYKPQEQTQQNSSTVGEEEIPY